MISIIYIALALALGLLISTVVNSQVAAMFGSLLGLMLPVLLLSGMMFPIENMPLPLQFVSNIIPARWYIAAVRKLMIEGLAFSYIAKELLILLGMTLFLITIALKKFKNRL
jgi:ABC-2 type transport system permease protein